MEFSSLSLFLVAEKHMACQDENQMRGSFQVNTLLVGMPTGISRFVWLMVLRHQSHYQEDWFHIRYDECTIMLLRNNMIMIY